MVDPRAGGAVNGGRSGPTSPAGGPGAAVVVAFVPVFVTVFALAVVRDALPAEDGRARTCCDPKPTRCRVPHALASCSRFELAACSAALFDPSSGFNPSRGRPLVHSPASAGLHSRSSSDGTLATVHSRGRGSC